MSRRSKRSKKTKKRTSSSGKQAQATRSATENVSYYFLAAVGVFILVAVVLALLGYLGLF